jgi:hypothetical protein
MGKASLTYYIWEGILVGQVAGERIFMLAASGGGGGTIKPHPDEPQNVNNPYATGRLTHSHGGGTGRPVRGGPIPVGRYLIEPPKPWHKTRAARLIPSVPASRFTALTGRSGGFLIHGRGPLGSDGCIVPLLPSDFPKLMDGLEADGGGVLTVLEAQGGSRFA